MADVDQEALEKAARITDAIVRPRSDIVSLSNGIVLKLKPVPPFLARQAVISLQRPKPPVVFLEDKGREEENPNDPEYQRAIQEYEARQIELGLNVMLLVGTAVETVPKGCYGPDDDEWLEDLAIVGIEVDVERPRARYLAWLRYYALQSASDIALVTQALATGVGLTEEEVQATADSFRSRAERRADRRVRVAANRDGDNLST